jgi:hypothetical protein
MRSKFFCTQIAIVAFSTTLSLSPVMAQAPKGALYAFHTNPVVGGCPGLDWHLTLGADDSLVGFVAWDQGRHLAKLVGTINKNRTFEMDAQEVGGQGRKATVKGTAGGDTINAQIAGSGTPCDGNNLTIPRVSGGMGGGGG